MYGLAAIQHANGWAMAGAGACIVLTGLAVLSFLISMIPRITGLFEPKPTASENAPPVEAPPPTRVPDKLPTDIRAASTIYIALTADLGHAFTLVDLHRKCREIGLPHPHLSINRFRDEGVLIAAGEDRFSWQPLSE